MTPTILFETDHELVIDKPSGLLVHPTGRSQTSNEPTLVDWIIEHYPDSSDVGEPWEREDGTVIHRSGIVHRLDRETSGVMVVAKTNDGFQNLKQQFKDRTVEKIYNCFVYGHLPTKEGTIDRPIGKSAKDFRLWSAQRGARGTMRDAITDYTVVAELPEASFLEVSLRTGRTHQIRVHMKAIHHPIVCDLLYAPKQPCILDFDRLALHARKIGFVSVSGERVEVEAPLPSIFLKNIAI